MEGGILGVPRLGEREHVENSGYPTDSCVHGESKDRSLGSWG